MKNKVLMYVLLLSAMFFLVSHSATALDSTASSDEDALIDSLVDAYHQQETAEANERKNSENLSDLKSEKKETKEKAKEAPKGEL